MNTTYIDLMGVRRSTPCVRELLLRAATQINKLWNTLVKRARPSRKLLSISETTAIGDRRFVTVVQFEQQRFLVGSSPSSVTLLTRLPDSQPNAGDGKSLADTGGSR